MKLTKYLSIAILPLIVAGTLFADSGKAKAIETTGTVVAVKGEDMSIPVKGGDSLEVGTVVKTDKKSTVRIAFSNGVVIALAENSEITITGFNQDGVENVKNEYDSYSKEPAGTKSNMKISLTKGTAYVQVPETNSGSSITVETAAGSVSGSNGTFSVTTSTVGENASMSVTAVVGSVKGQSTTGVVSPIAEGQTAVIEAGNDVVAYSPATSAEKQQAIVALTGRDPLAPVDGKPFVGDFSVDIPGDNFLSYTGDEVERGGDESSNYNPLVP